MLTKEVFSLLRPWIGATELRELVVKKEVSPREVADCFIARIEKLNPRLGAFMTITADRARSDAHRIEKMTPEAARHAPLFGVAYSLQDLTWTAGIRPPVDIEYAVKLRNAGGILLGKTATPELGGRPTTEGGLCAPSRNPWDLEHTAGGSSGGAASALAAGLGPLAEGSDRGGSRRIPAACCGVVGLKPSRGRISFAPAMGEAWAGFATSGPMGHTVKDVALMLDVMHGPAVGDPYWAPEIGRPSRSRRSRPPSKSRRANSVSA